MTTAKKTLTTAVVKALAVTAFVFSSETSRFIPKPFKWITVFLVALNIRSFPLVWHARVLTPVFGLIAKGWWANKRGGLKGTLQNLTELSPLEQSPLDVIGVWRGTAIPSDCDYNMHLSNSCYAKNLDYCRIEAAVKFLPGFLNHGGILAFGGSYINFIKEIPIGTDYEIRVQIGGWETDKWCYFVVTFISYPDKSKKTKTSEATKKAESQAKESASSLLQGVSNVLDSISAFTSVDTSGSTTPLPSDAPFNAPLPSAIPVPEGAVLHATAISLYCFKHGRITVPPRVVFILSGFGKKSRWERLQEERKKKGAIRNLIRGGWKEEKASGSTFWDFEEYEGEGTAKGETMRAVRSVMDSLGGR